MIFKPELVRKIQAGGKTMTRRPVKRGEKECRYKEGHVYSVQPGRGRPATLKITVTDVRLARLGELTLPDAKREGFRTTADFYAYWHRLYGPPASAGVRELERSAAATADEGELRAYEASIEESRRRRFERLPLPALPCLVWVISFLPGDRRDTPRLLRASAPQAPVCKGQVRFPNGKTLTCNRAFKENQEVCQCGARRPPETGEDHGYTSRTRTAMAGEPEAVSTVEQAQLTKKVREAEAGRTVAPIHGRHARLAKEWGELQAELRRRGPVGRELNKEIQRVERALERIGSRLVETA